MERELLKQIDRWSDQEEHQKIVDAVLALPEGERSDELMGRLAAAFSRLKQYDRAIETLNKIKPRQENTCRWQYRMGRALYDTGQYKNAREAFTRALLLDPPEAIEKDCREFLERIGDELAGDEDYQRHRAECEDASPELYSSEEMEAVEAHIAKYFGDFTNVFHEIFSPDIHVDICIVPPGGGRSYYTLVTMGMGAHRMAVPQELAQYHLERAELAIALPPDWKIGEDDEVWYWPIRLLKQLARLPGECDTWLGWGHTVDNQEPYAENTELCGALLTGPQNVEDGAEVCALPDGDEVNFYQVIPLYREEMEFKQANDADALLERLCHVDFTVDADRPNVMDLEDPDEQDYYDLLMDGALPHLDSIREKNLPVEELAAYNHLAIYLRWCIERDLMSELFLERYADVAASVKQDGGAAVDLRVFLRDEEALNGCLILPYFNDEGSAFARYYYWQGEDAPYYPADVDEYALRRFGGERYSSEEFQDEAYLFLPFDEDYYQEMKAVIDRRYREWKSAAGDGAVN